MDSFDVFKIISERLSEYKTQQENNEMLSEQGKWLVTRVIQECEKIITEVELEKEQYDKDHRWDKVWQ